MDLHFIARVLLAIFCVVQGGATLVLDLNRTHAAHPHWLGHARFHVVWQAATTATMALFEVALLLSKGAFESERFYLAAALAVMPVIGFFAALFTRRVYGGTLSDPGGIPSARFILRGREVRIDLNLAAEVAALVTLTGLVWLFRWAGAGR